MSGHVSRETVLDLEVFESLVRKWTKAINLIAKSDADLIWKRHILDSLQIWYALGDEITGKWLDLGSGGGFPALVIGIAAKQSAPALRLTCIESDQRKATFLRVASQELQLNVDVINDRIENVDSFDANYVSARALAPLPKLLGWSEGFQTQGTRCMFLKGASWKEEIELARKDWHFNVKAFESHTKTGAALLEISDVKSR